MDAVKEELVLVRSVLVGDEFSWAFDDAEQAAAWESALAFDEPSVELQLPELSIHLEDGVELEVCYTSWSKEPKIVMHAAGLPREEQSRLSEELEAQLRHSSGEEHQVLAVVSALQAYVAANPPHRGEGLSSPAQPEPSANRKSALELKVVLLWSHHLLATGKRKNIVQWSSELGLWGISKPGYPGVCVVEGLAENVDEFVWRIKQLNWKALQVRCEIAYPPLSPPSDLESEVEREKWALQQAKLAAALQAKGQESKPGAREVEGLNEVGQLMTRAGLENVFRTALKL